MFWLSFAIQWPNRDLYLFVFFLNIGKHARLVTCWRRWRSKVRNPMFLGRCKGTSRANKLHGSLGAESLTDVWQKWNLWSRFTSAVLEEWKDVRIFMEGMCPYSQNHWSKTNCMPVRCFFWQFSENSHQFIRDHLLQRCLKCCGCCTWWLATLFGDDPLTTSLGWCKRLGVFLKMHGASKKSDILWFSLLESRHFKEGFLIWVGA